MLAHLHARSWYSFLAGGSSPEALAERAADVGAEAVALTDRHGVQGAVRFQKACEDAGVRPVFGAEVCVEGDPLVLLAASRDGYGNLCRLLTHAHRRPERRSDGQEEAPSASFEALEACAGDLFCLTGTYDSRLWTLVDAGKRRAALQWVESLEEVFGDRLSIEVASHLLPGDRTRLRRLSRLSTSTGVPVLATGDVRYATRADHPRYDLLTCVRHGTTVFESHPDRPRNAEAVLRPEPAMRRLLPLDGAFERAADVARACRVDLLPGTVTPPPADVEGDTPPHRRLQRLCTRGLRRRYPPAERPRARRQLADELSTIGDLDLDAFFLVVREVVEAARRRGIRCAGRGSAANSIVAYLLEITNVDPIEHNLLFERFLHRGRTGTPDIDVDFDADRRDEVIRWVEERFGAERTAMTATVIRYRLRSALRDTAKALGWPPDKIDALTAAVPRRRGSPLEEHADAVREAVGASPLTDTLLQMAQSLRGCPRHLGLHSGGMVLSHAPLHRFSPVQRSAKGVRQVQFDKRDVEALGLVKLDILGLRMLSTISEAGDLVERYGLARSAETPDAEAADAAGSEAGFDLDALPLDDPDTFQLIQSGQTVGLFQIESQGQHHLLARHPPERFEDLVNQVALFRPGPLQGNMVDPFVRRRRGEEPVEYDHPLLEPILEDTYGIILFQEQVLEIAHRFAGLSLEEADRFRSLMSDARDPEAMEAMRERFVSGAVSNGVGRPTAQRVFDQVAGFVGYGFCRSHAAAFAQTVYQSAYLKAHHPAAFLAAVMQHRPGMYNQMTLEEEARRFGVAVRGPDVNRSGTRFDLEPVAPQSAAGPNAPPDGGAEPESPASDWAIRKPLSSVENVSDADARAIAMERLDGRFESVEGFYRRVGLDIDAFRSLARSGAMDALSRDGRTALWEVGVLHRRAGSAGRVREPTLFDAPMVQSGDIPDLPALSEAERLEWDLATHRAARRHPMTLVRRQLSDLEVRPIETCWAFGDAVEVREDGVPPILTVAGLSILRQKPSTAGGVMFLTIEDETGYLQCICPPEAQEAYGGVLRGAAAIIRGALQVDGNWRGLVVRRAWPLDGLFGGYVGHPSASGGRDRRVVRPDRSVRKASA